MADQHNDNVPNATNQILSDVTDIKENLEFHKDVFEALTEGWSNTSTATLALKVLQVFRRPKFSRSASYAITLTAGNYWCNDKYCFWESGLTTAAISTPSASTEYWLYLDYSAITTGVEITNSELIWSTTAPTYNNAYGGWFNGNDRAILPVFTNSGPTAITDFHHDGSEFILFDPEYTSLNASDVDTSWTDVTLDIPSICTRADITILAQRTSGSGSYVSWRPNGSSSSYLATSETVDDGVDLVVGHVANAYTDDSQIIEVRESAATTGTVSVYTNGFYFPRGM